MKRKLGMAVVWLLLLAGLAQAEIAVQEVAFRHENATLTGYALHDPALQGERPGVLVIHEWWGLNDYTLSRARQLAKMGYLAVATDMYGQGRATRDPKEAAAWAGHVRGTPLMRSRATAWLEWLRGHPLADTERLAAIGFCFGGTGVLELAYSGADLQGAVSFHGGLTILEATDRSQVQAKLLVLHGAEDPHIKEATIDRFQAALSSAGVDWQMIFYGGAVHSFSNPEAGGDPSSGAAYDPRAARRSWAHMTLFFEELFEERAD